MSETTQGNHDGAVMIVELFDHKGPPCGRAKPEIKVLTASDPSIRIVRSGWFRHRSTKRIMPGY